MNFIKINVLLLLSLPFMAQCMKRQPDTEYSLNNKKRKLNNNQQIISKLATTRKRFAMAYEPTSLNYNFLQNIIPFAPFMSENSYEPYSLFGVISMSYATFNDKKKLIKKVVDLNIQPNAADHEVERLSEEARRVEKCFLINENPILPFELNRYINLMVTNLPITHEPKLF